MIPHFDLPLRYHGGQAITVDQDSLEDIRNCVEAAVRTERGTRPWVPQFGIDDPTFENQPISMPVLAQQIKDSEPRATLDLRQFVADPDLLADRIVVRVNG